MRRAFRVVHKDGTSKGFEIAKYTSLKSVVPKVMLHIDELPDGRLLLICNEKFIEDFSVVDRIELIREP